MSPIRQGFVPGISIKVTSIHVVSVPVGSVDKVNLAVVSIHTLLY